VCATYYGECGKRLHGANNRGKSGNFRLHRLGLHATDVSSSDYEEKKLRLVDLMELLNGSSTLSRHVHLSRKGSRGGANKSQYETITE